MTTMPPSYSYGVSIINSHLYKNSSIVISDASIIDKDFWTNLDKYSVTTFGGGIIYVSNVKKIKV